MKDKLEQIFPTFGLRNLKIYYLLGFFSNGYFQLSNWLFYWLLFMNNSQIGILDTIAFTCGFLLEIPSGAIADFVGKRFTLIFGFLLQTIGVGCMAFGNNIFVLGFGDFAFFAGLAFESGALEALIYDSMIEHKIESSYDKVAYRHEFVIITMIAIAASVGGYLYKINPQYPWIAWWIFNLIALSISFFLIEPKVDSYKFSWAQYRKQIYVGINNLLQKDLIAFTFIFLTIGGIYRIWAEGILRPYMGAQFGFNGETLGYVTTLTNLLGAIVVMNLKSVRKYIGDKLGLIVLTTLYAFSFYFATMKVGILGGFVILLMITIVGKVRGPWSSVILNAKIKSQERATTLSTLSLFTQMPYAFTALVIGILADRNQVEYVYASFFIILMTVVIISVLFQRSDSK